MSRSRAIPSPVIALLGKKDVPTDGVEDYWRSLGPAIENRGYKVEIVRVAWDGRGWIRAWVDLWRKSRKWKGIPVLAQYTALMWSRRGFSLPFLVVLLTLKVRGARLITVFHDIAPYSGKRVIDRIRRACQLLVLRRAYGWAQAAVVTVPMEELGWLQRPRTRTSFIPVGASIPPMMALDKSSRHGHEPRTIAVFSITGGGVVGNEVADIAFAANEAARQVPQLKLVTLGRGSLEAEPRLRQALVESAVKYSALGVLCPQEVAKVLAGADVSLFVRGRISTQRTTAVASIACSLPLVAYADGCLASPLAEAGVVAVPCGDRQALAAAVVKVLTDGQLWLDLHQRSRRAYEKYFSWEAVATRFVDLLDRA
ncbi:MAG: glycosyltransferase family 4 protein [Terriglobia bacterium]